MSKAKNPTDTAKKPKPSKAAREEAERLADERAWAKMDRIIASALAMTDEELLASERAHGIEPPVKLKAGGRPLSEAIEADRQEREDELIGRFRKKPRR